MPSLIKTLGGAAGFGESTLGKGALSKIIDLSAVFPNGLNFYGKTYTGMVIDEGGVLRLTAPGASYSTPYGSISAFDSDVERTGAQSPSPGGTSTGSNAVYWDIDTARKIVTITWDDVGSFYQGDGPGNAFQLRLIDMSEQTGIKGDFDIVLRYEAINWTALNGFAGQYAAVGFSNGELSHTVTLPQSGDEAALLGLPLASNIGTPGVFLYEVRNANIATLQIAIDPADSRVAFFDPTEAEYGGSAGIYEGSNGAVTTVRFIVTRTGSLDAALDAQWTANKGTWTIQESDLAGGPLSGTLHFDAGQAQAVVEFAVVGDNENEEDEAIGFNVAADNIGASAQQRFYIANDDPRNAVGTAGRDSLSGSDVGDVIDGRGGNDNLFGRFGDDTLIGGGGSDALYGDGGNDMLFGGDGNDVLYSSSGADLLDGGAGDDRIGGDDEDTLTYATAKGAITFDLQVKTPQATGGSGTDTLLYTYIRKLTGSLFSDTLLGTTAANTISGLAGNDTIDGRAGADTMIGGRGNDTYTLDNAGDVVTEMAGEGIDRILARISHTLSSDVEHLNLIGKDPLNGTGNALANTIAGNAEANVLSGLGGADRLIGDSGDDRLIGGAGADLLRGGEGADTFVFDTRESSAQRDYLFDFVHGADKIELSQTAFAALTSTDGDLDPAQFAFGMRALTTDQRLIYNADRGYLFYDADGKGGTAQVLIALFAGKPALDAGDFVVA